ncbi:hypothetical protein, partial [Pantoea agglomerans]
KKSGFRGAEPGLSLTGRIVQVFLNDRHYPHSRGFLCLPQRFRLASQIVEELFDAIEKAF